jgi:LysM repeat protein
VISSVDNLSSIAAEYNVSEKDLRARNALYAENLVAGQVIKIPVG